MASSISPYLGMNESFNSEDFNSEDFNSSRLTLNQITEFHLFPNLPVELRLAIWERTMTPRLVDIDDLSGDRGPAVLRVNREARNVTRPQHLVYKATRVRDSEKISFFINPSVDIFNVCKFADQNNRRWQIVAVLNIVSCRYPPWLNEAQRLALSLSSDTHNGYPNGILEQVWRALDRQFPGLKELVLIMDVDQDAEYHELVTIPKGRGKLGQIVEKFEKGLKVAQGLGLCKFLMLSFMRHKSGPVEEEPSEDNSGDDDFKPRALKRGLARRARRVSVWS